MSDIDMRHQNSLRQFGSGPAWVKTAGFCAILLAFALGTSRGAAAEQPRVTQSKESNLLQVLRTNAPPEEKALACKRLAVYGSEKAVPSLAPLLEDEHLASWARIALEAIPGPAADKALRKAAEKLHGALLVGVLNSIGVRRDPKAVGTLINKLGDANTEVACAAADALGRIGGTRAGEVLGRFVTKAPPAVRPAVAEACVRCAEQFLAQKRPADAARLCDKVRAAEIPEQQMLEATRGAILARGSAGVPLLLEQLRAADRGRFGMALRTARELPGSEVTGALIVELARTPSDRQPMLLLALADRNDPLIFQTLVDTARTGSEKSRIVAVGALERTGKVEAIPALLTAATAPETAVARTAFDALARLPGEDADADLLKRLAASSGKTRQVLIGLCARRGLEPALPAILTSADSPDEGIRSAALQAIGTLGGNNEASALVSLLEKPSATNHWSELEAALVTLSGRLGTGCAQPLLGLAKNQDPALRTVALHALASAGGPDALSTVIGATQDKDPAVQNEAVRTLSSWPNTWPEDAGIMAPLLNLARTDTNSTHQVLALRGYLQFLEGDKQLKPEEKLSRVQEVLPLLQRPEQKRSVIGLLRQTRGPGAMKLLVEFAGEPPLSEDASAALLEVAGKGGRGLSRDERKTALETALAKSPNEDTRKKAEEALKKLE